MTAQIHKLTPKGLATRERIVQTAAELIYVHGVQGTSNELVRMHAGVSGSQLSHYFPDKQSLVRAVIAWRADSMLGLRGRPLHGDLDSLAALRAWADSYLRRKGIRDGGCSFGSLASEIMKSDLDFHDAIAEGFQRCKDTFLAGLQAMRDRGDLRRDADPEQLAYVLMAAFQGGLLLTLAERDVAPLRNALDAAIAHVASYAPRARRG